MRAGDTELLFSPNLMVAKTLLHYRQNRTQKFTEKFKMELLSLRSCIVVVSRDRCRF